MALAFDHALPSLGGARRVAGYGRLALRGVLVAANIVGAYVLGGMLLTETIDDRLDFRPAQTTEGGLASVDMAVALIEREVQEHAWVANEPVFMPGHWLPNMQAYQQGVMYGISRFALELADTMGRARGSTAVDPDLDRAAGLVRFPGDVWVFDLEKTWTPTVTSEEQYLSAARALASYNRRIAAGDATFNPRTDSLLQALTRVEADISSQINVLAEVVERRARGEQILGQANEVFYGMKGRLYAYLMILRELRADYGRVVESEGAALVYDRMLQSFENAAVMNPLIVTNGSPASLTVPSHLAELGFFALRAKTQMRDLLAVLQN